MSQPDHEILRAVLPHVLLAERVGALAPRAGTFQVREERFTDAQAALAAFNGFDGPGWLQDARTRVILHTATPEAAAEFQKRVAAPEAWPVAGERGTGAGNTSLHLRRTADGWVLTRLEEVPAPEGLLLTQRLLSADLKHHLVYHVAHRLERIGGHEELRPFASRFVGFEVLTPGTDPAATVAEPSAT